MAARDATMRDAREAAVRDSAEPCGEVRGKPVLRGSGGTERAIRPNDQRPGKDVAREQEEMSWASRSSAGEEGHARDASRGDAGGESGDSRVCGGRGGVLGRTAAASGRGRQRGVVPVVEG